MQPEEDDKQRLLAMQPRTAWLLPPPPAPMPLPGVTPPAAGEESEERQVRIHLNHVMQGLGCRFWSIIQIVGYQGGLGL